jgi:hypothetical protein
MQPETLRLDYASRETPRVWFARVGWAVSALFVGNAAATHVIMWRATPWGYYHVRPWLPRLDEPDLYLVLAVPCVIGAYSLMAVLSRHARSRAWHWLPPSILLALIAGGFFGLVFYDRAKWNSGWTWAAYRKALLGGAVVALAYLCVAFRKRSKTG